MQDMFFIRKKTSIFCFACLENEACELVLNTNEQHVSEIYAGNTYK